MKPTKIKAIVFDYTGVIAPGAVLNWAKDRPTQRSLILNKIKEKSPLWDLGKVNEAEFLALISEISGVAQDQVLDTIWKTTVVNDELCALIKKLKNKYKIVLFSNNFAPYLQKQIDLLEIRDLFDEIIISSDYKMKKPDPEFFKLMLAKTGLKEDEVLFTDDKPVNVATAEKLGIKSHIFVSTKDFASFLDNFGGVMLKKLAFIKNILNDLYRLGVYGLGAFSGTLSGLLVVAGVNFSLRSSHAYDEPLPDYANAMMNIAVRGPLWILGTLILLAILVHSRLVKNFWKKLGLFLAYLLTYWIAIFLGMLIYLPAQNSDILFSGFFILAVFPVLFFQIMAAINIFKLKAKQIFFKHDYIAIIIGALGLIFVFVYLLLFLFQYLRFH